MRRGIVILGVVILVIGFAVAGYFTSIGQFGHLRTYGSLGVGIIGILIAIAGAMMGPSTMMKTGQFTCEKCGAQFGSQGALDQHSRDKHSMQSPSQPASST